MKMSSSANACQINCLVCGRGQLHPDENFDIHLNNSLHNNNFADAERDVISKELDVVFILRNILGVSTKLCEQLLSDDGNPSSWGLKLCPLCQRMVEEAQFVSHRVKTLVQQYEELRRKLRSKTEGLKTYISRKEEPLKTGRHTSKSKQGSGLHVRSPVSLIQEYLCIRQSSNERDSPEENQTLNNATSIDEADQGANSVKRKIKSIKKCPSLNLRKRRHHNRVGSFKPSVKHPHTEQTPQTLANIHQQEPNEIDQSYDDNHNDDGTRFNDDNYDCEDIDDTDNILDQEETGKLDSLSVNNPLNPLNPDDDDAKNYNDDDNHEYLKSINGRYACPQCNYSFPSISKTKAHVLRVHHGVRNPHVCPCGAGFPRPSVLLRHKRKCKMNKRNSAVKQRKIVIKAVQSIAGIGLQQVKTEVKGEYFESEENFEDHSTFAPDSVMEGDENNVVPVGEGARSDDIQDDGTNGEFQIMEPRRSLRPKKPTMKLSIEDSEEEMEEGEISINKRVNTARKSESDNEDEWNPDPKLAKRDRSDQDEDEEHVSDDDDSETIAECSGVQTHTNAKTSSSRRKVDKYLTRGGKFKCVLCSSLYKKEYALQAHMQRSHQGQSRPFPCDLCKMSFGTMPSVLIHMDLRHPEVHYMDNRLTETSTTTSTTEDHSIFEEIPSDIQEVGDKVNNSPPEEVTGCDTDDKINEAPIQPSKRRNGKPGSPHECSFCKWSSKEKWILDAHTLRYHYGDKNPFECDQCTKRFFRKVTMFQHRGEWHPDCGVPYTGPMTSIESRITSLDADKLKQVEQKPNLIYRCTKCDVKLMSKVACEVHIRRAHQGPAPKFPCSQCDLTFLTKVGRRLHIQQFHEQGLGLKDMPLTCETCNKPFPTQNILESHRRSKHNKEKQFMCELCSKIFSQAFYLHQHQQRIHHDELGLNPFTCVDCGKNLNTERNLNNHRIVHHTKEFTYKCPHCSKGFATNLSYQNHMQTQHTSEKPFICSLCPKAFSLSIYLNSHIRQVHTKLRPYKCKVCGKEFADKPTYNRHMETHGSTIHVCPTCGKQFKVRHAFRLHLKSHEKGTSRRPRSSKKKVIHTLSLEEANGPSSSSNPNSNSNAQVEIEDRSNFTNPDVATPNENVTPLNPYLTNQGFLPEHVVQPQLVSVSALINHGTGDDETSLNQIQNFVGY